VEKGSLPSSDGPDSAVAQQPEIFRGDSRREGGATSGNAVRESFIVFRIQKSLWQWRFAIDAATHFVDGIFWAESLILIALPVSSPIGNEISEVTHWSGNPALEKMCARDIIQRIDMIVIETITVLRLGGVFRGALIFICSDLGCSISALSLIFGTKARTSRHCINIEVFISFSEMSHRELEMSGFACHTLSDFA
jgi:hypothetical protein